MPLPNCDPYQPLCVDCWTEADKAEHSTIGSLTIKISAVVLGIFELAIPLFWIWEICRYSTTNASDSGNNQEQIPPRLKTQQRNRSTETYPELAAAVLPPQRSIIINNNIVRERTANYEELPESFQKFLTNGQEFSAIQALTSETYFGKDARSQQIILLAKYGERGSQVAELLLTHGRIPSDKYMEAFKTACSNDAFSDTAFLDLLMNHAILSKDQLTECNRLIDSITSKNPPTSASRLRNETFNNLNNIREKIRKKIEFLEQNNASPQSDEAADELIQTAFDRDEQQMAANLLKDYGFTNDTIWHELIRTAAQKRNAAMLQALLNHNRPIPKDAYHNIVATASGASSTNCLGILGAEVQIT